MLASLRRALQAGNRVPAMNRPMISDQAESIALQSLAFLASDDELLPRFLALTGIEANAIRKAAAEPGFLAGVLAFFMAHEPSLLKLAEATGLKLGGFRRCRASPSLRRRALRAFHMSDDPETERQIAELSLDTRPLLVLDVDDVVLEFLRPFMTFLDGQDYELALKTFKLNGNIRHRATGELASNETVATMVASFFDAQAEWQTLAEGAAPAIARMADEAEIVMLTAMPHRFRAARRVHLDALGLPYPLVTTETAKGPGAETIARRQRQAGRLRRRHSAQSPICARDRARRTRFSPDVDAGIAQHLAGLAGGRSCGRHLAGCRAENRQSAGLEGRIALLGLLWPRTGLPTLGGQWQDVEAHRRSSTDRLRAANCPRRNSAIRSRQEMFSLRSHPWRRLSTTQSTVSAATA